ncbi:MAG: proprionate catabolism activator, Fis family [Massilibacillus sp.]|nr:proprionate catabolism activator, Fis family [Massilibacillus sp.]
MSKIAFITSDEAFLEQVKVSVADLGLYNKLDLHFCKLSNATALAHQLQLQDVDVIIARGGLAQLIIASNIKIPVVEVVFTGQDLAYIFQEAKTKTRLSNPKVAFIAFDNMVADVEILAEILNIDLTIYRLETNEDIPVMVEKVSYLHYDIILGGNKTVMLAQKRGLNTVMIHSGSHAVKTALLEAQKIALGRLIEKESAEKFKALIDYSMEGIISINQNKKILILNPAAERLLHCSAKDMIGQDLSTILDLPNIDSCLLEGQQIQDYVLRQAHLWINVNIVPIIVDNVPIGAFVTFQDISRIQEAEANIRYEVLVRKFLAKYTLQDIIGLSPQITEVKRIAREIARVDVTTLIIGDSGTGKELFAQSIHNLGLRSSGPFVAVNCAALPPTLLESELFGYVEGAFTGATKKGKQGLFEMAHKGTLFLDEISEMDQYGQSRLLRVLQERQIMRLGDNKYIPVDVRIIAASNKDLEELIHKGKFRQDLFYRLKVLVLNLPPLRDRTGDIEYLAHHFVEQYKRSYNKQIELTPGAYFYLTQYVWPGNVRELNHFIERLVITAGNLVITEDTLQKFLESREYDTKFYSLPVTTNDSMSEEEKIRLVLQNCGFNIKQSSDILGISRPTLYRKLKHYDIQIKKTSL